MVRHILADGREVDCIEGHLVPNEGATATVYRVVAEFLKNHPEIVHKEVQVDATA